MLSKLTVADWRHISETVDNLRKEFRLHRGELPEEDIMTSIGYVRVCIDSEFLAWASAYGDTLCEADFPTVVHESDAIHACQWDIYSKMDLTVEFIQEQGLHAAWRAYLLERAITELESDGTYVVDREEKE